MTKRFYKRAQAAKGEGGHTVALDGRPVRTPAKTVLVVPTQALAQAIAAEWEDQDDQIDHQGMVHMQLACTAIDSVSANRDGTVDALVAYAETDLLCYRADAPESLVERQARAWQPVLDWAEDRYGVRFAVTSGILPVDQPPETVGRLREQVESLDTFCLTGLQALAGGLGSLVLALAVLDSHIPAGQAFALSQLDEEHQAERWGADEEAEARKATILSELERCAAFLRALES